MALYKTITGWGVDWRDEFGRRHRRFVGSEEAARALEAQLRSTSAEARTRIAALSQSAELKLSEAFEIYLAHSGNIRPGTMRRYRTTAQVMQRHIGDLQLAQLTPALIAQYLKERAAQVAPTTHQKEASTIKNLFRFLRDHDHIAQDLAHHIHPGPKPLPQRKDPITYEQEAAILQAFTQRVHLKILLALDAGMRDGEIIRLRRNHIDLRARTVIVHTSKPRTTPTRLLPLTERLTAELEKVCPQLAPDSLIFTTATRQQTRASGFIHAAKNRLPVHFNMHLLRHTFATRLAAVAPNPFIVAQALGHKPYLLAWRGAQFRLTTPLYVHPTDQEMRAAIQAMEAQNPNCKGTNQR